MEEPSKWPQAEFSTLANNVLQFNDRDKYFLTDIPTTLTSNFKYLKASCHTYKVEFEVEINPTAELYILVSNQVSNIKKINNIKVNNEILTPQHNVSYNFPGIEDMKTGSFSSKEGFSALSIDTPKTEWDYKIHTDSSSGCDNDGWSHIDNILDCSNAVTKLRLENEITGPHWFNSTNNANIKVDQTSISHPNHIHGCGIYSTNKNYVTFGRKFKNNGEDFGSKNNCSTINNFGYKCICKKRNDESMKKEQERLEEENKKKQEEDDCKKITNPLTGIKYTSCAHKKEIEDSCIKVKDPYSTDSSEPNYASCQDMKTKEDACKRVNNPYINGNYASCLDKKTEEDECMKFPNPYSKSGDDYYPYYKDCAEKKEKKKLVKK